MNYRAIYARFIADRKAKECSPDEYFERHHIIPRSLGGSNADNNIVRLSAEDHYFAHCLLAKIYGGPMWTALAALGCMGAGRARSLYSSRRMVGLARRKAAESRSVAMRSKWANGEFKRVRVYTSVSAEQKQRVSSAMLGKQRTPEEIVKAQATKQAQAPRYVFVKGGERFVGTGLDFQKHSGVS